MGIVRRPLIDPGRDGSVSLVCLSPTRCSAPSWTFEAVLARGTFVRKGGGARVKACPLIPKDFIAYMWLPPDVNMQHGSDRMHPSEPGTAPV